MRTLDSFKDRAREFYFRADWESIVVLTVIGLCASGVFFMVAS